MICDGPLLYHLHFYTIQNTFKCKVFHAHTYTDTHANTHAIALDQKQIKMISQEYLIQLYHQIMSFFLLLRISQLHRYILPFYLFLEYEMTFSYQYTSWKIHQDNAN